MTLWGETERVHVQNMGQLHAHDCHQNVTEPQATEYHTKKLEAIFFAMHTTGSPHCCSQMRPESTGIVS